MEDRVREILRMAVALLMVQVAEEQVKAKWKSFGLFWQRSPSVAVSSLSHAPEPRQPKETA
jgi:hypothetical protein